MFDILSKGFQNARQRLSGVTRLSEHVIDTVIADIRLSLLEADVDFHVVKQFLKDIREDALNKEVAFSAKSKTLGASRIKPEQAFIKICEDRLVAMMGPVDTELTWRKNGPTGFMLAGLQGSGKTTSAGKLANFIKKNHNKNPLLVAADTYRPAAKDQLQTLGERIDVPVFTLENKSALAICRQAVKHAERNGFDAIIFDTAGRLSIDNELMQELADIKTKTKPANIFLVVDSMTGQDASKTAQAFDERLNIDGLILTKTDGDARGGAALSIKATTGKPIKFLGIGESLDKLEVFRPEGLASRILGMGDIVGIVKDFEDVVDAEHAEKAEKDAMRMLKGNFTMEDFLGQILMIQKMGSLKGLMEKIPFLPGGIPKDTNIDDNELVKIQSIIHSMTKKERLFPDLLITVPWNKISSKQQRKSAHYQTSRIHRIAQGSGHQSSEVTALIQKFGMMRQMMSNLGSNSGMLSKLSGMKNNKDVDPASLLDPSMMNFSAQNPSMLGSPTTSTAALDKKQRAKSKAKRKTSKLARKKSRKKR